MSKLSLIKCVHQHCSRKSQACMMQGSEWFKAIIFNDVYSCDTNKYVIKKIRTSKVLVNAMKIKLLRPSRVYKPKYIIDDC